MICIEIGQMPPLLRSIVRSALEAQEDFVVVDLARTALPETVDRIDVVIVSDEREKFGTLPLTAFAAEESPRIVAIAADGHSASIVRLTAEEGRLEGAADLSAMVRRAALERRRAIH